MPSSIPQMTDKSAFLSTMQGAISSFRCGIQRTPFRSVDTTNCSSAFTAPINPVTRKLVALVSDYPLSMQLQMRTREKLPLAAMMEILFFLQLHFPHKNSFLLKKRQRLFYSLCRFYFCNIQLFQESKRAYDWCFLCFSETYLEEADNLYNEKNYRTNSTCDWNNHGKEKNHCNNSN